MQWGVADRKGVKIDEQLQAPLLLETDGEKASKIDGKELLLENGCRKGLGHDGMKAQKIAGQRTVPIQLLVEAKGSAGHRK